MKLLVSGSRGLKRMFLEASTSLYDYITSSDEVLHGDCEDSPDMWADKIAKEFGVPITPYPADWKKYGTAAGPIRNEEMVKKCDMAIIIWNGVSNGSRNVIELCQKYRKTHLVVMSPKAEQND